ncbi:MAG: metallophosphoesterase [Rhodospirillales bacterium]|nr:metallophosphoesterase [Rhodospirillales bacterium]
MGEPVRVVHITDCHLTGNEQDRVGEVDTRATLAAVLEDMESHPAPDLILATGDLSQDGSTQSYGRFAGLLAQRGAPVYCLGGNHDAGGAMLAILVRHGLHLERVLNYGAWFIHLLPTALAGRMGGRVQEAELEVLDTALRANRDKHALICMHHHPVPVGGSWGEEAGIENPGELFEVTDRHANLRGFLWGHVHQSFESQRNGVQMLGTPSTSFDVVSDAQGHPSIGPPKPGYRRMALHEDGTIESEVHWVNP